MTIRDEYFEWMYNLVCRDRYDGHRISYRKLLMCLHSIEFTYLIPLDGNRAEDGIDLRYQFAYDHAEIRGQHIDDIEAHLDGPCSVLEMMIALAIHCEATIMDPRVGDRTKQWFWEMIVNLGLGSMYDSHFNRLYVEEVIQRFLNRDYEPDGRGGLFRIRHCDRDLREVEIWYQLCEYMNSTT